MVRLLVDNGTIDAKEIQRALPLVKRKPDILHMLETYASGLARPVPAQGAGTNQGGEHARDEAGEWERPPKTETESVGDERVFRPPPPPPPRKPRS